MIDSLLIMKNDFGCEGFFKFEGGYKTMTVGVNGNLPQGGRLVWRVEKSQGGFIDGFIKNDSPVKEKPHNFGIFLVKDEISYPLFSAGKCNLDGYIQGEYSALLNENRIEEIKQTVEPIEITDTVEKERNTEETIPEERKRTLLTSREVKEPTTFFDCNAADFLTFLEKNPKVEIMDALIPGSRWAKGDDYILGIIFDENESPMYLCYGFELPWSENPPEKLGGYCQWIPVDCSHPRDNGYWVVYVNAATGERVK